MPVDKGLLIGIFMEGRLKGKRKMGRVEGVGNVWQQGVIG